MAALGQSRTKKVVANDVSSTPTSRPRRGARWRRLRASSGYRSRQHDHASPPFGHQT